MHPDPEDIGFFCAVVIGPRKGKGSQAKGSARNRRGRIPIAPDSCRKRAVPARTFSARSGRRSIPAWTASRPSGTAFQAGG